MSRLLDMLGKAVTDCLLGAVTLRLAEIDWDAKLHGERGRITVEAWEPWRWQALSRALRERGKMDAWKALRS